MEKENSSLESLKEKAVKNSVWNFLLALVSKIGALIFTIIVARMLFPEVFGIYSLALTIILVIATFTDAGLNTTVVRYVSEALGKRGTNSKKIARSTAHFILRFKVLVTFVTAILLFFLADSLSYYIFSKPELAIPLKLGALYLIAISLQGFLGSLFLAIQKVNYQTNAEAIFQITRIIITVILFWLYAANAENVLISLIIASAFAIIFFYLVILIKFPYLLRGDSEKIDDVSRKRIFSFFGWTSLTVISLSFFAQVDTFMIGIFLPAEFVGFYSVIFSIIGTVGVLISFSNILLPAFTQVKKEGIQSAFTKVIRYSLIISIPASVGLAFVIIPVIKTIYGTAYVPPEYAFSIFIAGILLSFLVLEASINAAYTMVFQAEEMPKLLARLIIFATLINILLNYALIKAGISYGAGYGLTGVALATFISRYGKLIGTVSLARKKINLRFLEYKRDLIKPIFASTIMALFLYIFIKIFSLSIFVGISMILGGAIVYFIALFLIKGIVKEDLELLNSFFRK